jgi:PAS domain S-box-containing protein
MPEISFEKEPLRAKSPLRLLQVEHEADDIELCLRELKKSGLHFEVDTVATREVYVQKLSEKPFDVVIADYRLPGWTGMDALAEIKQRDLNIPLILVTGTLGDRLAVECIKEGITDYVLKDQLARLPAALIRAREEKELRDAETRAMEALRASEARYRGLVQNATYGMLWVTADGDLLAVNPAFVRMLGYDAAEEILAVGNIEVLYRDSAAVGKVREKYKTTLRRRSNGNAKTPKLSRSGSAAAASSTPNRTASARKSSSKISLNALLSKNSFCRRKSSKPLASLPEESPTTSTI